MPSGINYGITMLPTVTGEDQDEWALGDLNCFMMTTSATEETKKPLTNSSSGGSPVPVWRRRK